MAEEYDVVILGGGSGGYVSAIQAAQLGLKTALVEREKLGGTCLHKGCIPSKALLRSAEVFQTVKNSEIFGVIASEAALNFGKVQERKQSIIATLYEGVKRLIKKGRIDVYEGTGRILGPSIFSPMPGTISVEMNDGTENKMLVPKNVIIATGSRPRTLPGLDIDGKQVLSSDEALEIQNIPDSILIVGGGVIGVEWASMLCDFGAKVTILEFAERILPLEDEDISKEMARLLEKRGVNIITNAKVLPETLKRKTESVSVEAEVHGEREEFQAEKILVSVGRQANVEKMGLENTEIELNKGFIQTNEFYQTKESHIYAVGDVIGGMQLAHVAAHEGMTAVSHLAGRETEPIDYTTVSCCIYSNPEIASVGLTEKGAEKQGYEVKVGKFPFSAAGKALVYGQSEGFVKIIADQKTDDVLGVHMIGPHVTDMISEAGLAKLLDAASWEIGRMIHPHPTLSEAIGEAALAVEGRAIHI